MGCRLCIKSDVCNLLTYGENNEKCDHFKNKKLLLELPCEIGAIVYKITTQRDNYDDREYKTVIQVYFRLSMLEQLGKTVFLNNDEALSNLNNIKTAS